MSNRNNLKKKSIITEKDNKKSLKNFLGPLFLTLVFFTACQAGKSKKRVYYQYQKNTVSSHSHFNDAKNFDTFAFSEKHSQNQNVHQNSNRFKWQIPSSWQVKPQTENNSKPRLATFVLSDQSECTLTIFHGQVGSLSENIIRWLRQMGQPQYPNDDQVRQKIATFVKEKVLEKKGNIAYYYLDLAYFLPTDADNSTAIMVAVFPLSQQTLFLKLTANRETLKNEKENFLQLANSITIER